MKNETTEKVFKYLYNHYSIHKVKKESYFYGLKTALNIISMSLDNYEKKIFMEKLNENFKEINQGLTDSIKTVLYRMGTVREDGDYYSNRNMLKLLLNNEYSS